MSTRVITAGMCLLSFPSLFKARKNEMDPDKEPRFEADFIIQDAKTLKQLKAAAQEAAEGKWGNKIPKGLRSPFKDGDDPKKEDYPEYHGKTYIKAWSESRPGVCTMEDGTPVDVIDQNDVYAGCFVRVSVTAFAYEKSGNKGVSFQLNNVCKVKDGDSLGAVRIDAVAEFGGEVDAEAYGEPTTSSLLS